LAIATYLAVGVILTLALLRPYPLMEEADPFSPLELDPDWYLVGAKRILDGLPGVLSTLVLLVVPLLFICLPCIERRGGALSRLSTTWRLIVAVALTLGFILLTWG
jgi:quinol-cytochrome oxidoreductase complex cytochrome b subunit